MFYGNKKLSVTQLLRLPRQLVRSLAELVGIGCLEPKVRLQGLAPARPCLDQRFVSPWVEVTMGTLNVIA